MALITCKDCEKEFSTDAKRCPHCGAKHPARQLTVLLLKILGALIILPVLLSLPAVLIPPEVKKTSAVVNPPPIHWPVSPDIPSFDKETFVKAYFNDSNNLKPKIIGYSNMPDGTEIMVSLYQKDIKYSASAKTIINAGQFVTEKFTALGANLPPGQYDIHITTALPDLLTPSVREVIGSNGENLKGKYTRTNYGITMIDYKVSLKLGDAPSKEAEDQYKKAVQAQAASDEAQKQAKIPSAQYACKEFVKRQLHNPKSAEFDNFSNFPTSVDNNIYTVEVSVRARNSFNALIKTVFNCEVVYMGNDKWIPSKIEEAGY